MKRIERLHAISEMLRRSGSRGCTADRLADEFAVSVRTIKRDIDALECSGAAIWSRPGPRGGYGLITDGTLPPVSLTPAQAVALLTAIAASPHAPYADLASVAVRKIVDVLDPHTRVQVDTLAERIWVDSDQPRTRAVRSALEKAMSDQLVVRIGYGDRDGQVTTRDVEPVVFASTNGHWYLIGWCRFRDAMRWFRVSRISRATVTTAPCTGHAVAEIGPPPATSESVRIED